MATRPDFETMFHPKSIAIIGASPEAARPTGGANFINTLRELDYEGRIYPVNPKGGEILGLKAYPNIAAVPEVVDLAISSVPARLVPQILNECADAGVKNVHLFTAGFREVGETGADLERKIIQIAKERELTVVGPNCMGLYVPKSRIVTWRFAPKESGPVGMISQSGGIANEYTNFAAGYGVHFSKVISFGNGTVLDSPDFLEYFADDPETEIMNMYLEGIVDGRRLTNLVREINRRKPIIILKGGMTTAGARAAASHTGSLTGSEAVWGSFFKQTGATRVNNVEELLDATITFRHLPPLRGRGIGVLGGGGGMSVAASDALNREGLDTPTLSESTRRAMREYVPEAGSSVNNPLDAAVALRDVALLKRTLDLLGDDPKIDCVLLSLTLGSGFTVGPTDEKARGEWVELLGSFARTNPARKPLVVVLRSSGAALGAETDRVNALAAMTRVGIPVYPTLSRAAIALGRFYRYHELMAYEA